MRSSDLPATPAAPAKYQRQASCTDKRPQGAFHRGADPSDAADDEREQLNANTTARGGRQTLGVTGAHAPAEDDVAQSYGGTRSHLLAQQLKGGSIKIMR